MDIIDAALALYSNAAAPTLSRVAPLLIPWYTLLFTIDFGWTCIRHLASGAERLFEVLLPKLLVFLIGWGLIILLPLWLRPLLRGWEYLGQLVTGLPSLTPSALLDQGLLLAVTLFDSWQSIAALFTFGGLRLIVAAIVLIAYVSLALALALVILEGSLYIGGLPLMLIFGGHSATFGITEAYIRGIIQLGIRIYVLYLIVAVGRNLGNAWAAELSSLSGVIDPGTNLEVLTSAILLAIAAWILPNRISRALAGGFSFSAVNPLNRG